MSTCAKNKVQNSDKGRDHCDLDWYTKDIVEEAWLIWFPEWWIGFRLVVVREEGVYSEDMA